MLLSPGVEITVTDESFFTGAGPGTVPLIFIATRQDKTAPDGSTTAAGTTAANANNLYLISSQRELLQTFGNPDFNEVGGSSQHGYPLNEYGLLAAYSYLGVSNRAYVIRSDVDLAELEPTSSEPAADPANNLHWVDLGQFRGGIFQWSGSNWIPVEVDAYVNDDQGVAIHGSSMPSAGYTPGDIIASFSVDSDNSSDPFNPGSSGSSTPTAHVEYFRKDTNGVWQRLGDPATGVDFQWAPHTSPPSTQSDDSSVLATGDIWLKTTTPNLGLRLNVKRFDASINQFVDLGSVTVADRHSSYYTNFTPANQVEAGTVVGFVDTSDSAPSPASTPPKPQTGAIGDISLEVHNGSTTNTVTGTQTGFSLSNPSPEIDINGTTVSFSTNDTVDNVISAINSDSTLNADDIVASKTAEGALTITRTTGEDIVIANAATVSSDIGISNGTYSNFEAIDVVYTLEASAQQPSNPPAYGTLWYDPSFIVDILENDGTGSWQEFPEDIFIQSDDPTTTPSTVADVSAGDLWIETDQTSNYPVIRRRNSGDTAWVLIDNTDQTTPNGIVFADARENPDQGFPLDNDAPDPLLYPGGTLLFNTRYSGRNVKRWTQDATELSGTTVDRWVSESGLRSDGSPYMGVDAQKQVVVDAIASTLTVNEDIRNDTIFFNLIAAPGFTEVIDEMLTLNVDRKERAFVIGDAPFHLSSTSTALSNWASNNAGATDNGPVGLVSSDPNLAVYYPSGLSTNVDGSEVVVPASHMVLRVMAYNDEVAYPWFAPAGFSRGTVTNASSVGYLNSEDEFVSAVLTEGQRDALYLNNVNPIATLPGQGLVVYGQKTRAATEGARDRVNVSRLVNYIRTQSDQIAQPFLFQPNDSTTRNQVRDAFESFLAELVTLRGINDYLVVVDESNNTPARIDRNELWADVLIQPIPAVEFILIPVRLRNTGDDLNL